VKFVVEVWALWVPLSAAGGTDSKSVTVAADESHKVAPMRELRIGRCKRLTCVLGIAPEGEDIRDPLSLHPVEDLPGALG
jgi:hypothetical protein